MNAARLNTSTRAARVTAERNLSALTTAYEGLIRQAGREAATALLATTQTATLTAAVPNWQIPPQGILLATAQLAERAGKKLAKLHRRAFQQTVAPPLARAGIAWDITHPVSQTILDQLAQRTGERLGATVQPKLGEIVAGAYSQGLSVNDTATLIREGIADVAPEQARMLARTDLNSISNGGSVMAAQMIGVQYKQWLTAEDDRVRQDHAAADGQTVPIDQPFDVGGEQLDYPGDPGGSDDEVCNCRCTVVYVDAAEAETASACPVARVPSRGFMAPPPAPVQRVPARGFAAAAVTVTVDPEMTTTPVPWMADLAFEDAATEDGRYILLDALTWRELPLSLGAMFDTPHADMVMSAPVCGRIDTLEKTSTGIDGNQLPDGMKAIRGYGQFDMAGEVGPDVARMVTDETMRGVSVDLAVDDWCFRDPESGSLIDPDAMSPTEMEAAMMGELQYAVRAGTIMAATVCPTPAFADARIMLASGDRRRMIRLWTPLTRTPSVTYDFPNEGGWLILETSTSSGLTLSDGPLTASAAGLAPTKPPADWFTTPEATEPTPLTVTKDGRVFGHMALWDSCHTGYPGQCVPPPRSPSGYAYFNLGEVECADGSRISCGAITLEALHADPNRPLSPDAVRAHYEHTGVVGAYVRAVDGRHGIWVSGALRASLSERHARDLMGAKPSGDWRQMRPGGPLEMLGVHAVNEPGFPVPRLVASALLPSGLHAELRFAEPNVKLERSLRVLGARAEGLDALVDLALS